MMVVLSIIGAVIMGMLIYWAIEEFNKISYQQEKYHFFTREHTIAFVVSYIIMLVGFFAMKDNWLNDWINGAVIFVIGMMILGFTIHNNFKNTSRSLAITGSIFQVVLYIPITVAGIFILFVMAALFSQTKPVYSVNSKD